MKTLILIPFLFFACGKTYKEGWDDQKRKDLIVLSSSSCASKKTIAAKKSCEELVECIVDKSAQRYEYEYFLKNSKDLMQVMYLDGTIEDCADLINMNGEYLTAKITNEVL